MIYKYIMAGLFLMLGFSMIMPPVYASNAYGMEIGDYATFPFDYYDFMMDDMHWYDDAKGEFSWECIDRVNNIATVRMTLEYVTNAESWNKKDQEWIPNEICFEGQEYIDMYENWDYSFLDTTYIINEIPKEKIYVDGNSVVVEAPFEVSISADIELNLETLTYHVPGTEIFGRWIWTINPDSLSMNEEQEYDYSSDYYSQDATLLMHYLSEEMDQGMNVLKDLANLEESSGFYLTTTQEMDILKFGISGEEYLSISNLYNDTNGMLLAAYSMKFTDDVSREVLHIYDEYVGIDAYNDVIPVPYLVPSEYHVSHIVSTVNTLPDNEETDYSIYFIIALCVAAVAISAYYVTGRRK